MDFSGIKNIFKKEDPVKKIEPPKEIPESKLKGIKIYAPDLEMYDNDRKDFEVHIFDKDNKPVTNEIFLLGVHRKFYKEISDETGCARLKINLNPKKYEMTTKFPAWNENAPIVYSDLTVHDDTKITYDQNTKLYAPSMTIYANEEPDYTVRLTDTEDNPISNEEISIRIGEKEYIEKTDSNGFASIFSKFEAGTYPITVEYKGNDEYDPIMKESELEVLVRNIDKEVMIEVNNLVMEFKVSKDKIDTLKEYIIRTIKRNKSEKQKVRILDDISFKVYKGERLGILGFNGAGKSTLLKIITGIYEPTSGEIIKNGKIAPLLELGAGFDKNYTGENNIYLNGALLSMREDFINEKFDEIVEYSELGEFIKYPVKNYSSGMRSKLGFSIATLVNPDILIVDEILSVGDIKFRKKSAEKIQSLMEEGVTVLLVTHSINQVKKICDRCIWLENGKIIMEGPATDVCREYEKSAKATKKKKAKPKKSKKKEEDEKPEKEEAEKNIVPLEELALAHKKRNQEIRERILGQIKNSNKDNE